jgi:surface polysaccharide O-acyltransferase-like enzyme
MKEGRVYSYDLIKSIAIYLVCLYHFGLPARSSDTDILKSHQYATYFNYFFIGISSIGVPLFFMVNGALLLNKTFDIKKHIYKIMVLFLLYILWGAITLIIEVPIFGDHYSLTEFFKVIYYTKQGRINNLWFLPALIYVYILFPLIKSLLDKNEKPLSYYLWVMIFIFTFGIVFLNDLINVVGYFLNSNILKNKQLSSFPWFNPFNLYFSYALIYFLTGGWLVKFIKRRNFKTIHCLLLLLLSWCLLSLFGLMMTNITREVYDTVWYGYDTIMTLAMTISVFILCSKISVYNPKFKKVITTIGANTLGIYFIHYPLGYWFKQLFGEQWLHNHFFLTLLYSLLLMLLSLLISLMLRRIPIVGRMVKI